MHKLTFPLRTIGGFLVLVFAISISGCAVCLNPDGICQWQAREGWIKYTEMLKENAEKGDPVTQRRLGLRLLVRNDWPQDDYKLETHDVKQGIRWLEIAADRDESAAKYHLGRALVTGKAVRITDGPQGFLSETSTDIQRNFPLGIELMKQASRSSCDYGNGGSPINATIGTFYREEKFGTFDRFNADLWLLRHLLICDLNRERFFIDINKSKEDQMHREAVYCAFMYERKKNQYLSEAEQRESENIDQIAEKLRSFIRKESLDRLNPDEVSRLAAKFVISVRTLNRQYPLRENFVSIFPY